MRLGLPATPEDGGDYLAARLGNEWSSPRIVTRSGEFEFVYTSGYSPEMFRTIWPRLLATLLFFVGIEGLLFHSGIYAALIQPDSGAGWVESLLRNELRRAKPDRNQVLAVGHSRMALLPRVANEMKAETGYTFGTIALGGTSPRGWYYELRAVDPTARAYAAIVIPSDDYDEPDGEEDLADRETDPYYLVNRLQLRDLRRFSVVVSRQQIEMAGGGEYPAEGPDL